jgi:glycosyltransferase involved in cell wall biosynthesis
MPRHSPKPRLLVFVISYYAEASLRSVLDRIPRSIFEDFDCEVLVVDDASQDRTFAVGHEYRESHPEIPMRVLRNQYNQGYGGNQKVGYSYAIANRFDWVAMVHGDGQYAPEELPRLIAPLVRGEADAVFGSRMILPLAALRGGMPLYKYVGNRILSTLQNRLLGMKLSEFHSGYRLYSVRALERIPFQLNSNDFHFDTEIIIQLANLKARIVELPIPTYYGNEICRVNGMKYARDVVKVTLQNVAHRKGILYQRRFDQGLGGNTHYDLKLGYASSHTYALEAIPDGASVLDIGGGPGWIARELLKKGCRVTVVEAHAPRIADPNVTVIEQNLDDEPTYQVKPHDYILMLDVIEHLKDPELFIERLRRQFDYQSKTIVLTTPNIAFIVQRLMLLFGHFNYGKAGILDRTHTRLFTFRAIGQLLRDSGFRIERVRGIPAPFPLVFGNGAIGRAAVAVNLALIRVSKTLFAYQVYVEARSTPHVDFVLQDATLRSATAGRESGGQTMERGSTAI